MSTKQLHFNEIVENIYNLPLDVKQELKNLLENNIAKERRTEIAQNIKLSKVEEKDGKLQYSSDINKLKQMNFETIDIIKKKGIKEIIIPEDLKISAGKVYLKSVGNSLFMIPLNEPWKNMIDSLDLFTPDYMEKRNQSENQQRDSLDL